MSAVNILLAILGSGFTLMVVVGMVLITPGGAEAHPQTPDAFDRPSPSQPPEHDRPVPEASVSR